MQGRIVTASDWRKAPKVGVGLQRPQRFVPSGAGGKALKHGGVARKHRAILDQTVAALQLLRDAGKRVGLLQRTGAQAVEQPTAPNRLLRAVDPCEIQAGFAVVQPAIRQEVALGRGVDIQNQRRNSPVVASRAKSVHKQTQGLVALDLRIPFLQKLCGDLLPQRRCFCLLQHPKIRRHVQLIGEFPDQIGAESVYGGDLGHIDSALLFLQVAVVRVQRQSGRQLPRDPRSQLGSRFLREGDD